MIGIIAAIVSTAVVVILIAIAWVSLDEAEQDQGHWVTSKKDRKLHAKKEPQEKSTKAKSK